MRAVGFGPLTWVGTRLTAAFGGLSLRRKILLTAVALLLVGCTAVFAASWLGGPRLAVPPQDRPGPVLLVPGYGGGTGGLDVLAERLRAVGRVATVIALPGSGTGDLAEQARVLDGYVERALRDGAPSVDVVGHSAGGVVARLWAQTHDGVHKARRIVTLGSPHHGASLAAAGAAALPAACPIACQQLAPGSRLLAGLTTPVPVPPQWMALWTLDDTTVTPPDSARLEGAANVALQSLCPGLRVSHGELPSSPIVGTVVLGALGPEPLANPQRC